ncbi:hypothetical protein POJ06DRAFT_252151 [Lipomyces tetrasporus]|uniref:Uncharacterized protein n=1 Tax=Lipomyces tetrasporus TaxID=54092 RepID=A0AAD7QRS9_9ASCO|nr:uncharacterized protein POJ06DRAFT_252151 [Lipomyces tetrasporus]KAJ8100244.1 hypothetical protein POJ06DRAFT_252151 [Lipomyces tetrasporus]
MVRESRRFCADVVSSSQRKAVKSFTLSDGTFVLEGTMLKEPATVNQDPDFYDEPTIFNSWKSCSVDTERKTTARVTSITGCVAEDGMPVRDGFCGTRSQEHSGQDDYT